jgi:ribonuclease HII
LAERAHGTPRCTSRFEKQARAEGYCSIAGVDEVGRGSLFGSVFAGAVILPVDHPIRGLRDSKILEAERRQQLAERIRERAVAWAVAAANTSEIERLNIYQASRLAMRRAVEKLQTRPDYLLVDFVSIELPLPQLGLIDGDARSQSIAAASILAKVERDQCMVRWDAIYPQYGLARHKGYYTPEHIAALDQYGPTPLHRFSFDPVRRVSLFEAVCEEPVPEQQSLFEVMEAGT